MKLFGEDIETCSAAIIAEGMECYVGGPDWLDAVPARIDRKIIRSFACRLRELDAEYRMTAELLTQCQNADTVAKQADRIALLEKQVASFRRTVASRNRHVNKLRAELAKARPTAEPVTQEEIPPLVWWDREAWFFRRVPTDWDVSRMADKTEWEEFTRKWYSRKAEFPQSKSEAETQCKRPPLQYDNREPIPLRVWWTGNEFVAFWMEPNLWNTQDEYWAFYSKWAARFNEFPKSREEAIERMKAAEQEWPDNAALERIAKDNPPPQEYYEGQGEVEFINGWTGPQCATLAFNPIVLTPEQANKLQQMRDRQSPTILPKELPTGLDIAKTEKQLQATCDEQGIDLPGLLSEAGKQCEHDMPTWRDFEPLTLGPIVRDVSEIEDSELDEILDHLARSADQAEEAMGAFRPQPLLRMSPPLPPFENFLVTAGALVLIALILLGLVSVCEWINSL